MKKSVAILSLCFGVIFLRNASAAIISQKFLEQRLSLPLQVPGLPILKRTTTTPVPDLVEELTLNSLVQEQPSEVSQLANNELVDPVTVAVPTEVSTAVPAVTEPALPTVPDLQEEDQEPEELGIVLLKKLSTIEAKLDSIKEKLDTIQTVSTDTTQAPLPAILPLPPSSTPASEPELSQFMRSVGNQFAQLPSQVQSLGSLFKLDEIGQRTAATSKPPASSEEVTSATD